MQDTRQKPRKGSNARRLMDEDWSGMTVREVAAALNTTRKSVVDTLRWLWTRYGYAVPGLVDSPLLPKREEDKTQVVHGKCTTCAWYYHPGPCCDFNMEQYPTGIKHGPIDEKDGGCDAYEKGVRNIRWTESRWLWMKEGKDE